MGDVIINFRPICIKDKPLFDQYFQQRRYDNSHANFTTKFIWRDVYELRWTLLDGCLCFIGNWHGEHFILLPMGRDEDVGSALNKMHVFFQENSWPFIIRDIESSLVDLVRNIRPGRFKFIKDRANFDYVYSSQDLIELKGRRYSRKKNHVNAFRRLYGDYTYLPIDGDLINACINYEIAWCENRGVADGSLMLEKQAVIEALQNFIALKLVGAVIFVEGKVAAFTFGERLNEDTAVIHVEKAKAAYRGLYAVINQEFCANQWRNMKYINRQEDLGIPGLIQAKKSYFPVKMIEKYIAVDNE